MTADAAAGGAARPAGEAGPPDPDDPTATYALDPRLVQRLVRHVVAGPRAQVRTTTTPFTGGPLAQVPVSTAHDVEAAFASARAAQREWARRPLAERARVLLRFHDLVLARQDEVLDLIQLESGKARKHAFEEVLDSALVARHYARRARSYLAPRRVPGPFPLVSSAVVHHRPKGVVGVIAPWNYPLDLAVCDALPALVSGNAVVLKPDHQTPLTALWALDVLREAGLPEGLLKVVLGDGVDIGGAVIERADYVCFTGSTATGRVVAAQAARRLVGASLELGGKNPLLVLDDADLDRAAEGAVRACFASAGQLCVSAERLLVHEDVADAFLDRFLGRVRAMRLAAGTGWLADMGSLVSERQLATVQRHVEDARAKGAVVLHGGRARPDVGPCFYEPTVLAGVTPAMAVCDEETFGPVVSLSTFRTEDEALALANRGSYGLNASVWTRDLPRGRRLAARIAAGTVNLNEAYGTAWAATGAPMGGMRDSGLGRRHGAEGILKYTESQTVAVQRVTGFGAPLGLEDQAWARILTMSVKAMKKAGMR